MKAALEADLPHSGTQLLVPPARMAHTLRMLAVDAVEQAASGHPGAPMGMADIAVALWHRHLRHKPAINRLAERDRLDLR